MSVYILLYLFKSHSLFTLLIYIQDILVLNLGMQTTCPDSGFLSVS
jgi:hypothetical protein